MRWFRRRKTERANLLGKKRRRTSNKNEKPWKTASIYTCVASFLSFLWQFLQVRFNCYVVTCFVVCQMLGRMTDVLHFWFITLLVSSVHGCLPTVLVCNCLLLSQISVARSWKDRLLHGRHSYLVSWSTIDFSCLFSSFLDTRMA